MFEYNYSFSVITDNLIQNPQCQKYIEKKNQIEWHVCIQCGSPSH